MFAEQVTLVIQAQQGQQNAFTALMEDYRQVVRVMAYSYLGNWDDAEDAVQEVFIRSYLKLKYLHEPELFGAWLRKVTMNVCTDLLRRRKVTVPWDEAEEYHLIPLMTGMPDLEARVEVRQALASLPERIRQTVLLSSVSGFSHEEISRFMEIPVNTVRSRLQRARKLLSKETMKMVNDKLQKNYPPIGSTTRHLLHSDLVQETALVEHNRFLYALVNILQLSFGDAIRAIYLVENFAWNDFLPICYIFRSSAAVDRIKVLSIAAHLMDLVKGQYQLDPLYIGIEDPFYDADDFSALNGYPCTPITKLAVKEHSLLLFGEDIRSKITLTSDKQTMLRDVLTPCLNWIKQAHNVSEKDKHPLDQPIHYPLHDPAPEKEDRGFGDLLRVSTRAFHLARALLYLATGRYHLDQMTLADEYARHASEPWSTLIHDLSHARYEELTEQEKRKIWLKACRQMTAFENYFLRTVADSGVDLSDDVIGL